MNEHPHDIDAHSHSSRRFATLIVSSIVVALVLVSAALALYSSSGAEQLDLSRPGYAKILEQANRDDSFKGFSSNGQLDKTALDEFEKLYVSKMKEVTSIDAFGGDVLSQKSLQIDQESVQLQQSTEQAQ